MTTTAQIQKWLAGTCMVEICEAKCTHTVNAKGAFFSACETHAEEAFTKLTSKPRAFTYMLGESCPICKGRGYLAHYSHIDRGQCYRCKGSGIMDNFKKVVDP